jgi:energy-coupling factor transporter ATP-binding protein EcfA2
MKIAKLITWQWGSLESREWQFADTVLLTGESGSGKSTLLDSIQTLLTAAHHHLVQFNIGQDESTQSRRGGKEPRTLAAYALGQQADGVFLRKRSTSYVAMVLDASAGAGELEQPFTVLVGVEAHEDAAKAVLARSLFFIVRRALGLPQLLLRTADGIPSTPVPVKDLYLHLQHQLRVGPEVVQRFEDKSSYLTHLYGAMMGKTAVSEAEAFRAAKSIVKAMAYKELGNVNDLVRDEILDAHDFSRDLDKMRELMRSMAGLKAEAERLQQNIERLEAVEAAATLVVDESRRFVVHSMAYGIRALDEAESELEAVRRQMTFQHKRNQLLAERLQSLREVQAQLGEQLDGIKAKLAASDVAQRKAALESEVRTLQDQFRRHWLAIGQAAQGLSSLVTQLERLLALDLSEAPALDAAVAALRPAAQAVLRPWPVLHETLRQEAKLDAVFPAFDLESFDSDLGRLEYGIRGHDEALSGAVVTALTAVSQQLAVLQDEKTQRDAELRQLQSGRSPAPNDVRAAIDLIERELPQARPHILSELVEPKPGSTWQHAIEGYMGGDRFALIVEAGFEAACTRLVKRKFPIRSPKVVQGSKAIDDTRGRTVEARAVMHELVCSHPVAKAFLLAQYGRVRKVDSEDELARTPQGLMEEGIGSRGYGMFSCRVPDQELAFGEATRKRRRAWCEQELSRIAGDIRSTGNLQMSLNAIARMFSGAVFTPLAPLMDAVLISQLHYAHAASSLAALDLSAIDSLEAERQQIERRIDAAKGQYDGEMLQVGENNKTLKDLGLREKGLLDRLPTLQADRTNALVWATRFVAGAPDLASEAQLHDEARSLADSAEVTLDALRHRAAVLADRLPTSLRGVSSSVQTYLIGARSDQERFLYADPPKSFERIEELLPPVIGLRRVVGEQALRQRSIGLAENVAKLREAESSFNAVFTTSFCFKVRDEVRQGASTLQKLNRELKNIQFGTDTFELEWTWVPRLQKVFEFFEAMEGLVDSLEKDAVSIFDSPRLSDEHRQTAQDIRRLLLANDQGSSERALKELADYRNYRRYDIVRHSPVGQTKLSTWGTGSGGELETPFYVIRSAVLAHALGHFGRDRRGSPALRLMLSDEAFSKMDESRSRSVLQFLSRSLGLQLVVAMPTSKSGAVKPEFDKEFTFSKVLASREGAELFVSEVQEKTIKREPLARLWAAHAEQARESARVAHSAKHRGHEQDDGTDLAESVTPGND